MEPVPMGPSPFSSIADLESLPEPDRLIEDVLNVGEVMNIRGCEFNSCGFDTARKKTFEIMVKIANSKGTIFGKRVADRDGLEKPLVIYLNTRGDIHQMQDMNDLFVAASKCGVENPNIYEFSYLKKDEVTEKGFLDRIGPYMWLRKPSLLVVDDLESFEISPWRMGRFLIDVRARLANSKCAMIVVCSEEYDYVIGSRFLNWPGSVSDTEAVFDGEFWRFEFRHHPPLTDRRDTDKA